MSRMEGGGGEGGVTDPAAGPWPFPAGVAPPNMLPNGFAAGVAAAGAVPPEAHGFGIGALLGGPAKAMRIAVIDQFQGAQ